MIKRADPERVRVRPDDAARFARHGRRRLRPDRHPGLQGGRLVVPVGGYYHASKYAVEALTDALRFEAAPFGIKVSLIEPGLIRTGFGGTAAHTLSGSAVPSGPYVGLNAAADQQMAASYRSTLLTAPPEAVAAVIERAILAARPRPRYLITPAAKFLVNTRRLLGARVFDAYLRMQFRSTAPVTDPAGPPVIRPHI